MLSCSYSRLLLSVGFSFSRLFISTSSYCALICINVVTINSIVVVIVTMTDLACQKCIRTKINWQFT